MHNGSEGKSRAIRYLMRYSLLPWEAFHPFWSVPGRPPRGRRVRTFSITLSPAHAPLAPIPPCHAPECLRSNPSGRGNLLTRLQQKIGKAFLAGAILTAGIPSTAKAQTNLQVCSVIPASAHAEGAANSAWRTDLTLYNASNEEPLTVQIAGARNQGVEIESPEITLNPQEVRTLNDTVLNYLGKDSWAGALWLKADDCDALHAESTTYNDTAEGRYGQGVSSVKLEDFVSGESGWTFGPSDIDNFRTNLIMTAGEEGANVNVKVWPEYHSSSTNTPLAEANYTIPAYGQLQINRILQTLGVERTDTMLKLSSNNTYTGLVSFVDNRSNDGTSVPIFVESKSDPSLWSIGAHAIGNNAYWITDFFNFNPHEMDTNSNIGYRERGSGKAGARTQGLNFWQRITYNDIIVNYIVPDNEPFSENTTGTLWTDSTRTVIAFNRTYNNPSLAGSSFEGTFGQGIPCIPASNGASNLDGEEDPSHNDDPKIGSRVIVFGVEQNSERKSNVGVVNASMWPIDFLVELYDNEGNKLGEFTDHLEREQYKQYDQILNTKFGYDNVKDFRVVATPQDYLIGPNTDFILLYNSTTFNNTRDPAFNWGFKELYDNHEKQNHAPTIDGVEDLDRLLEWYDDNNDCSIDQSINTSARGPPPEGPDRFQPIASDPDGDPLTFGVEVCYDDIDAQHAYCASSDNVNPMYANDCSRPDVTCYDSLDDFSNEVMPFSFDEATGVNTIDPDDSQVRYPSNSLFVTYYVFDGYSEHVDDDQTCKTTQTPEATFKDVTYKIVP